MHGINASSLLNNQQLQQFSSQSERSSLTVTSASYSSSESFTTSTSPGVTVSISQSSRYLQKSVSGNVPVAPSRQTPEQTASNILGPIKDRLESARENGASDKELRSLLREGYKGFKQGFREAFKTLEHSGNLDPALKEDLKETKHLVRLGFSELRQEFAPKSDRVPLVNREGFGSGVIDLPRNPEVPVTDRTVEKNQIEKVAVDEAAVFDRKISSIKEENFNQTFAETNRATRSVAIEQTRAALIEVTTNDGDVVTVDIASIIQAKKNTDQSGVQYTLDSAESSGYIVEGELDVGELKALDELLDQVDTLATQFFDGNVAAAFESALALGFDTAEIASFSVALSESTSVDLTSAYVKNSDSGEESQQGSRQAGYRNLGDYVASLQQAVQTASLYSQPANLVSTLLSTRVELYEASYTEVQSFNKTNDELLGVLTA